MTHMASRLAGRGRSLAILAAIALTLLLLWAEAARQANPFLGDVLRLLALVSAACAWLGTWLVLRRMAMMADAIAHALLFGIVVMLWLGLRLGWPVELSSPLFVLGAAGAGLLTVLLTEGLMQTGLLRQDAAIGMVFTFLFALALVVIAYAFGDAHVDEHLVLAGGVENTVFRRLVLRELELPAWLSLSAGGLLQRLAPPEAIRVTSPSEMHILAWNLGPRATWTMLGALSLGLIFVGLFWKELKLTTFDAGLAASLGLAPVALNYALMGLVSVTAVGAFEAVGSIIVIALFVAPPATAFLLTEDLLELQLLGLLLALLASGLGFRLGLALDASFGGSVTVVAGLLFALALLLAPERGLLAQALRRRRLRRAFALDLLLVHLLHHESEPERVEERDPAQLPRHLRWTARQVEAVLGQGRRAELLRLDTDQVRLTASGRERARRALARGDAPG